MLFQFRPSRSRVRLPSAGVGQEVRLVLKRPNGNLAGSLFLTLRAQDPVCHPPSPPPPSPRTALQSVVSLRYLEIGGRLIIDSSLASKFVYWDAR